MNAIYQPQGKAAEYAEWACNFYVGCCNNCSYCYLKQGRGAKILGGCTPTLKKCFKDEAHAFRNGYKPLDKVPRFTIENKGISIGKGNPDWGYVGKYNVFIIHHGNIIEQFNIK